MYYAFALRTGSPHRVLCITYYVLRIVYYALPLGVNIVCYVLCITYYAYYALRTGSPHRLYYVCLLYTSPSPRDVEESRMPSSA